MIIEQDGNSADSRGNNFISHLRQLEKIINKLKGLEIKERNGKLQKEILWNILIWIYNKCIIVTAPSRTLIEELKNKGIKTKLIYLSNGLDRNKFKPKKEYKAKSFKILHVGRLGYEKNVDVLIKAMPFILKDFPQTKLTIVGDGPALNSLAILVKQLNLGDSVIFTGFITNNELPTIFRWHSPKFHPLCSDKLTLSLARVCIEM
jgi:glycosyltransferase involved in cell wall biosynthesis